MKLKTILRSAIAGFTAFAMAATMMPTTGLGNVQAASTDSNMILHWDMTFKDDSTLKDVTNNGHDGTIVGEVAPGEIDGIRVVEMSGNGSTGSKTPGQINNSDYKAGYVTIPDGTISRTMTSLTINMLVKTTQNNPGNWMWTIGSNNNRYLYFTGCCSKGQGQTMRGGACYDANNSDRGWEHESVITSNRAITENEWQNMTVTYTDGGDFIYYQNGVVVDKVTVSTGAAGTFTLQNLMTARDGYDGYMGHSFYFWDDPDFQGKVADFRIYNKAMSQEEVTELQGEIDSMLKGLATNDFSSSDIDLTEEDCLGDNTSKSNVISDLKLPATTTVKGKLATITNWVSSDPDTITIAGKVTRATTNKTVTLTATVELNTVTADKELTFTVPRALTDAEIAQEDINSITIPNQNDIRGNIYLPTSAANGSTITWESSDESIITSKDNGKVAAGKVTRSAENAKVTLTATFKYKNTTNTKTYDCTVRKAYDAPETTDYLFAYFPYAGGHDDERIYFATSEDGLNFTALNNANYVIESKLGSHGLRDPFIIRSHEGDKFYMIATDLTVSGLDQDGQHYPGQGWNGPTGNQQSGSQSIMIWESTDLVNWSEQRMRKVAKDNAGCTWAPEAYWDDELEEYVVFWASKTSDDGYGNQRVYYATTRDFDHFSEAKTWISMNGSVIDTTVIKVGEYYYRYTKNEAGGVNEYGTPSKRVFCERSQSLTSTTWEKVHENSLNVSGGQIEGPCIFKLNNDDRTHAKEIAALKGITLDDTKEIYCLTADQTGSTIFPGLSDDIESGSFGILGQGETANVNGTTLYTMPKPIASHGTIMPITSEEYNNLKIKWDSAYKAAAQQSIDQANTAASQITFDAKVSSDLTLPTTAGDNVTISWTSSDESVITSAGKVTRPAYDKEDAIVTLTAEITVKSSTAGIRDQKVTKTYDVTVEKQAAPKYTVTFDSKGGSKVTAKTVESGKKVASPKNPTKKGYTFAGWYNGKTKYNFSTAVKKNLTLTAKWTKVSVKAPSKAPTLKNKKSKQLTVTIKKVSGAAGYQVTYSTSKKFTKKTTKTAEGTKTTITLKKLKKGKTYYVKVKAYKKDSTGAKVYSKFSKVKSIKIKK